MDRQSRDLTDPKSAGGWATSTSATKYRWRLSAMRAVDRLGALFVPAGAASEDRVVVPDDASGGYAIGLLAMTNPWEVVSSCSSGALSTVV